MLKSNIFAPKQGYITLGGWSGFSEEIPGSDSSLLIIDGEMIYLFTSPLLPSVCLLCLNLGEKKKRKKTKEGNLSGR